MPRARSPRDEGAKLTDATLPTLDHFLPAIERCIVRAPVLPALRIILQ